MTYDELKAAGAEEFLTVGPNSGGAGGFLVHEGLVWGFEQSWYPEVAGRPIPASEFLERYGDDERRGYWGVCDYLRKRLA